MKKYAWNSVIGAVSIYKYEGSRVVFEYMGHLTLNDSRIPAEVVKVLKIRVRLGEYRPVVVVDDEGNILMEPA